MRRMIEHYLRDYDVRVTAASCRREAAAALAQARYDVVVLDLRLPDGDGMDIVRIASSSRMPVIVVSARSQEADRVMAFEHGVDHYLTKPFSPRELLARIRAVVRRAQSTRTTADTLAKIRSYHFAMWQLNVRPRRLKGADGSSVGLTNGAFNLLVAFLACPQQVLSRDELLRMSRMHEAEVYDRSIDVRVARLRRVIEVPGAPPLIRTERGAGYVFTAPVEVVR